MTFADAVPAEGRIVWRIIVVPAWLLDCYSAENMLDVMAMLVQEVGGPGGLEFYAEFGDGTVAFAMAKVIGTGEATPQRQEKHDA